MKGARNLKFVKWDIKQGTNLLALGQSLIMANQEMKLILRAEIARLSKELGNPEALSGLIINASEPEAAALFKGLALDRCCPDHLHDSALKHNMDPKNLGYCGKCGKPTQWMLVQIQD